MPSYDGRVSGRAVCPLCREMASSEAEMSYSPEGRFATLERGGDVLRGRGSRGEPSSEAEIVQWAREGPSSEAEVCCAVEGPEGSPRARRSLSPVRG